MATFCSSALCNVEAHLWPLFFHLSTRSISPATTLALARAAILARACSQSRSCQLLDPKARAGSRRCLGNAGAGLGTMYFGGNLWLVRRAAEHRGQDPCRDDSIPTVNGENLGKHTSFYSFRHAVEHGSQGGGASSLFMVKMTVNCTIPFSSLPFLYEFQN